MFQDKEAEKLEGVVERVVYQNPENGYAVAELEISEAEYETIFGIMPFIAEGETVTAYGQFVVSPKYGRQFRVEHYEKQLPETESMMIRYLASGNIKGIGPVLARKIVAHFGTETFDVMEKNPEWLADIPGVSLAKAKKIGEDFASQHGLRTVMTFCGDYFSPSVSIRVFKRWGTGAVDVIKSNPYILCDGDFGIGFEKADKIAAKMSIPFDSMDRLYAGLKFILGHNAAQNGHTYVPEDKLLSAAEKLLGADSEKTADALEMLIKTGICTRERVEGRRCVYLTRYYDAERTVAEKLHLFERNAAPIAKEELSRAISIIEAEENIKYAKKQKEAIEAAMNCGVMVLTGGPGTGKTTVIRAIIRLMSFFGIKYALAAPTGRAAKRMSEATGCEAKTIHRLLEVGFDTGDEPKFMRCRSNPLEEEIIIIDEASMIDVILMKSLLDGMKNSAKLILIGDYDQLPSVGAGNVLCDIIESDAVSVIRLTEIFRQAKESLIVTNAHAINAGRSPDLETKNSDFFFLSREGDEEIARTVTELCKTRLPRKYGDEILESLQVITPTRMTAAGVESLNVMLQAALNPPAKGLKEIKSRGVIFREGDKVMQVRNNYDIVWRKGNTEGVGIYNGDIGTIEKIDTPNERLLVNFEEKIAEYDISLLDELEHAYAVTVHKSQGSEYKTVIIPVFKFSKRLLTRNLLYTAVTRAQKMVILVGQSEAVDEMVNNNRHAMRYTSLKARLTDFSE